LIKNENFLNELIFSERHKSFPKCQGANGKGSASLATRRKMKIKIDRNKCIGCGLCKEICGASFELTDGKAKAKKSEVKKLTNEKEAAESCPVGAISIS
jgi:ferredoxin